MAYTVIYARSTGSRKYSIASGYNKGVEQYILIYWILMLIPRLCVACTLAGFRACLLEEGMAVPSPAIPFLVTCVRVLADSACLTNSPLLLVLAFHLVEMSTTHRHTGGCCCCLHSI